MAGPGTTLGAGAPPGQVFSVREFARTAVGDYRKRLDLDAFVADPLPADVAERLRIIADFERATMLFLRRVLVTPTHKDARVTAFLTTWAFEKFWISDAVKKIADTVPRGPLSGHRRPSGVAHAVSALRGRLSPISRAIVTNMVGSDIIGAYTTAATVDEWVMHEAYRLCVRDSGSAALDAAVTLFLDTKSRHVGFLEAESVRRLEESARTRRLTRSMLPRISLPIGSDEESREADRTFWAAFDGSTLSALDDTVSRLPSLEGTALISAAARRAAHAGTHAHRAGIRVGHGIRSLGGRL